MALAQTIYIDFRDQRLRYSDDSEEDGVDTTYTSSLSMHSRSLDGPIDTSDDDLLDDDKSIYLKVEPNKANRNGSFGTSWGVSSIGRGFDWKWKTEDQEPDEPTQQEQPAAKPIEHPESQISDDSIVAAAESNPARPQSPSYFPQGILFTDNKKTHDLGQSGGATSPSSTANGIQPPTLSITTNAGLQPEISQFSASPTTSPSDDVRSPLRDGANGAAPALRSRSLHHLPGFGSLAMSAIERPPPIRTATTTTTTSSNASTVMQRRSIWSRPVSPSRKSPSLPRLTSSPSAPLLSALQTLSMTPVNPMMTPPTPRSPRLNRSRQSQKRISLIAGREVAGPGMLGAEGEDDGVTDDGVSEGWISFRGGRHRHGFVASEDGRSGYSSPRPLSPSEASPIDADDDDPTPNQHSQMPSSTSLPESPTSPIDPSDSFVGRALQIKAIGRLGSEYSHPPTPLRVASQSSLAPGSRISRVPSAVFTPPTLGPVSGLIDDNQIPSLPSTPAKGDEEGAADDEQPQYPSLDVPGPAFSLARLSSSWSLASGRHSHTPSTASKTRKLSQSRSHSRDAITMKRLSSDASDARRGGFLGGKTISDYVIVGEAGRGAYGLVKRAREKRKKELVIGPDGEETYVGDFPEGTTIGPPLIIKQIIKSRILADCWKKHPIHGTIPIEIFVMSALSGTSYVLPTARAWDPDRFERWEEEDRLTHNEIPPAQVDRSITPSIIVQSVPQTTPTNGGEAEEDRTPLDGWRWKQGELIQGHPNICPLLDFFEDHHYYYLVLPATKPSFPKLPEGTPCAVGANGKTPSDLFDLVELYAEGLPAPLIRSFLGQIADALSFLHARGICHRDIKDENVVLGERGRCWLIDFGSSGVVRKNGWDSFSGTLDYAAPEILHGDRYAGPPQDVWAFGIVAYVLLTGECPFSSASEAAAGIEDPECKAAIALRARCSSGPNGFDEGLERDGGGRLGDAMELVRRCLELDVSQRPTMEEILTCRFLNGGDGWGFMNELQAAPTTAS